MTVPAFTSAYVFARLSDGERLLVGNLELRSDLGTFIYDPIWLERPDTYPLDPVNLPLSPREYRTRNAKGMFGVFSDAGPDDWGTRILLMQQKSAPKNELERLLRTSGGGAGLLEFSLSRTAPREHPGFPGVGLLEGLADTAAKIENRARLTNEQLALIDPGSSMGGARPKVVVADGEGAWLVKFSRPGDLVDLPRLEFATLQLMKHAGFFVPEIALRDLGSGRTAFLSRRFDREPKRPTHFISANSLFNIDRLRPVRDSLKNPYSYVNLANIIRRHAADPERDCLELYRRMLLNIFIGNTDDHARNHALIYDTVEQVWRLSPAYDVLPTIGGNRGRQAMGVGSDGGDSTAANALSYCKLFMLSESRAGDLIAEIRALAQTLPDHAVAAAMREGDVDLVRGHLSEEL